MRSERRALREAINNEPTLGKKQGCSGDSPWKKRTQPVGGGGGQEVTTSLYLHSDRLVGTCHGWVTGAWRSVDTAVVANGRAGRDNRAVSEWAGARNGLPRAVGFVLLPFV
jgi:hypothetical protein